jgi:glycosyltransferase involved in cell wall biosynthesis
MKTLMFGWEFPPIISGGLGTACYGMTKHLSQLGNEILFVLPKGRPNTTFFENFTVCGANEVEVMETRRKFMENISEETVQLMSIDAVLSPYMDEHLYLDEVGKVKRQRRELVEVEEQEPIGCLDFQGDYGGNLLDEVTRYSLVASQLAKTEKFDLIHAHDWMTFLAGIEAKKVSGKPLVCHVHATEHDRAGRKPSDNIMAMEKHGLERADLVIAVSRRTKRVIVRNYGIKPDKIRVVHNAVNKERSLPKSLPDPKRVLEMRKEKKGDKIVLFLGRVTMQKGPDYFVEAARMVLEQMSNVQFVMAGGGDMLPRMIERVAAERLHDRFHFTGFLDRERVEMMYAMSDLYVMPSVSEPFGITPFEAMVYEVPIIVSRQSGITEVLEHAVKVDFWDVHELADSIVKILKDEEFARESGSCLRNDFSLFLLSSSPTLPGSAGLQLFPDR